MATDEAPTPGAEVAREERAPLLQVRAVEPRSISVAEGPWPSPRSSVEESFRLSSHFLSIISDYYTRIPGKDAAFVVASTLGS